MHRLLLVLRNHLLLELGPGHHMLLESRHRWLYYSLHHGRLEHLLHAVDMPAWDPIGASTVVVIVKDAWGTVVTIVKEPFLEEQHAEPYPTAQWVLEGQLRYHPGPQHQRFAVSEQVWQSHFHDHAFALSSLIASQKHAHLLMNAMVPATGRPDGIGDARPSFKVSLNSLAQKRKIC